MMRFSIRYFFLLLVLLVPFFGTTQSLTTSRQKALNNYIQYINATVKEGSSIFNSLRSFSDDVDRYKKRPDFRLRSYNCPVQPDDISYTQVLKEGAALGAVVSLNASANDLHTVSETLKQRCRDLEVYCKLEDYKTDQFQKFDLILIDVQKLLITLRQKQQNLAEKVTATGFSIQPYNAANAYHKAEKLMSDAIREEKAMIDSWTYNFRESIHTGWPSEKLSENIIATDKRISVLKQTKLVLASPSDTPYKEFSEDEESYQQTKRNGLDGYNYEACQSDKYSNELYLELINYYNGMLVDIHNRFVNFSGQQGYYGIEFPIYMPVFEFRTEAASEQSEVKLFANIARKEIKVTPQAIAIPVNTFNELNNYVEYINESLRQVDYLQLVLQNYNSSAVYYKDLTTYKGKGGLTYDHNDFKIPLSLYQKAMAESNVLPASYRSSLNEQTQVLQNILKEMDQLSVALTVDAKEKRYQNDNLKRAYEIMERYALLFETFDSKKEQLYTDVKTIFNSYKILQPANSWMVSGTALLKLVDHDKEVLFKAKAYYKGDTTSLPSTLLVEEDIHSLITNEYTNMKGIEKIGRNSGLCPYTPYEYIPDNSKTFSGYAVEIKKKKGTYRSPYHDFIYLYNTIIEDYNKFCSLAKVKLLNNIKQPDLYVVKYPEKKVIPAGNENLSKPVTEKNSDNTNKPEDSTPKTTNEENSTRKNNDRKNNKEATSGRVIHDTIRIVDVIRVETIRQDTVYIQTQKSDTVYISDEKGNSMDGYATNNMVFLLDVSGSMKDPNKLPLLKKAILLLVKMLREEDELSIVVYSGTARVVLPPISCKKEARIKQVIEKLISEGNTDANAGIKLAYKTANDNYIRGGNNRIILATDGEFPVSKDLYDLVQKNAEEDIYLSVFYFGTNTTSENLSKLSADGKGNFEHITHENVDAKLIREAKAKKKKKW
jgi:Ca-activated chloride channel family protein